MLRSPLSPKAHLFVCANRRPAESPLGAGCGNAGEEVFAGLKRAVLEGGRAASVWVTQTQCLGICPKRGATVAIYPQGGIYAEVVAGDTMALLALAEKGS
jgi:predicted metal-binding protein